MKVTQQHNEVMNTSVQSLSFFHRLEFASFFEFDKSSRMYRVSYRFAISFVIVSKHILLVEKATRTQTTTTTIGM
jgi:hypothetical protein